MSIKYMFTKLLCVEFSRSFFALQQHFLRNFSFLFQYKNCAQVLDVRTPPLSSEKITPKTNKQNKNKNINFFPFYFSYLSENSALVGYIYPQRTKHVKTPCDKFTVLGTS